MAIAGRVAIVPKGEWNAQTAYKRLDAVTYNNTLYFAKKDVPAGTATTNAEYWSKSISGSVVNVATDTEDGLMPKEDKKKLDGIDGDVAAKLGESKDGSLTYNGTEIKPSVETGQGLSIGEDGKLQVNIDGTTLTMDEVHNVIKLADTLKNAINGAFPAANVANNQVTTEAGFALDARQANPNLDGTLAKQISDLNGSMLLFTIGIIRDESIEKAITLFHSQHKGYSMEMSFFLDGSATPNDIPDKTTEWEYCSGKYIVRNSYNNTFDGHIFLFGFGTNRIACKSVTNGVFSSSWDIK